MGREIALFVGKTGETVSFFEAGEIIIYEKLQGQWNAVRQKGFSTDLSHGLKGLRRLTGELIEFLGQCRIVAALSVNGVPYYELEKAGYSVWEIEGRPSKILDYILQQEEEADIAQSAAWINHKKADPVEISDGCYHISLTDIQAGNADVTSKQVLLPFLRKGEFYSLEVVCTHMPPWLEAEILLGKLEGEVRRDNKNLLNITITKKICD